MSNLYPTPSCMDELHGPIKAPEDFWKSWNHQEYTHGLLQYKHAGHRFHPRSHRQGDDRMNGLAVDSPCDASCSSLTTVVTAICIALVRRGRWFC